MVQLVAGLGFLSRRLVRPAAWLTIALSILFWWVGQGFAEMMTPLGTDLNAGPLWVLLALCAVPSLLRRAPGPEGNRLLHWEGRQGPTS
jgi:hypothetical protein